MLKKIMLGLLLTSSLFAETELWKFFKYSTAYASFSLNAPRYQDDRFSIAGGLSTGDLIVEREEGELKADFQKSFGLIMNQSEELKMLVLVELGMMAQNKMQMRVLLLVQ